jgi:hypothetical protein
VADTTTATYPTVGGVRVKDLMFVRTALLSMAATDEVTINNSLASTITAVIGTAQRDSQHTRYYAIDGTSYLGKIAMNVASVANYVRLDVTFTPLDGVEQTISGYFVDGIKDFEINMELEPLTDVTFAIADDGATPAVATVQVYIIEVD